MNVATAIMLIGLCLLALAWVTQQGRELEQSEAEHRRRAAASRRKMAELLKGNSDDSDRSSRPSTLG